MYKKYFVIHLGKCIKHTRMKIQKKNPKRKQNTNSKKVFCYPKPQSEMNWVTCETIYRRSELHFLPTGLTISF